jgi:serine/threonine protein phosphatase PrpC
VSRSSGLEVAVGFVSLAGRRPDNQDFGAAWLAPERDRARFGMAAAVADGVSGARGGRLAAEAVVRGFLDGYYSQPETIGIAAAGERVLAALNGWVHAMGRTDPALTGCATTFTALVLRGRQATTLHVGDSRAWLFHDGRLTQLTEDHVHSHPDQRHVLIRAIGIEPAVRIESRSHELATHDRLLLTSDGVHGVLSARAIARLLEARGSAQADAEAIAAAALDAGSRDNVTALLIDVTAVPPPDRDALAAFAGDLPIEAPPRPGDRVDGFTLRAVLSDGRYTRVFIADDTASGEACVLKFPKPALLSESGARLAFLREMLIGARVDNPYVGRTLKLAEDRQSRLYVAMPYYEGETLEARLTRGPVPIRTGVQIGAHLARGVSALHRLGIIHRDIKPENVILTAEAAPKLIDLGVARLPKLEEFAESEAPGTPSYMAPELFRGAAANEASDQFALGVTLYRLFTQAYPYGEIEPFTHPRFQRPASPSKIRADMPAWLEAVILRTIDADPANRYADTTELIAALEAGAARAVGRLPPQPLIERDPVRFWQAMAALLALALLASLLLR